MVLTVTRPLCLYVTAAAAAIIITLYHNTVFSPLPGCFEHFGLDFMLDTAHNVWLLEANPGPDFKQTGAALKTVIAGLIEDTLRICVDGEPPAASAVATAAVATAAVATAAVDSAAAPRVGGLQLVYSEQWSGSSGGAPSMRMV
jgi:Tubulin-tyrosine ligase family